MRLRLFAILLVACRKDGVETAGDTDPVVTEDSGTTTPVVPPPVDAVIFVTVDALNARFYGDYNGWNVTPGLDGVFAESVVMPDTYSVRGLTRVALSTLHTGLYPRHTTIRNNEDENLSGGLDLFALFHDAGWQTLGMSSNQCGVMDYFPDALDRRVCYSAVEHPEYTQTEADALVVTEMLQALEDRDPSRPVFARLHLSDPHWPYTPVEPWMTEFYPEPWTGEWDATRPAMLLAKMLDPTPITDAEREYLHAVYASQVRATDELLAQFFDGLRTMGLYENVVIVFGSDHGDELGIRTNFMYHGCSVYNTVIGALYAVKAPGLAPGSIPAPVSIVNMTPTVLELAGVAVPEGLDGTSLVPSLTTLTDPGLPVYFERSPDTAGVVEANIKVILSSNGGFDQCSPYNSSDLTYPNDPIEVYDLLADPDERTNLVASPPAPTEALHDRLCSWITGEAWQSAPNADDRNRLVTQCRQRLGIPTESLDTGTDSGGHDSAP